MLYFCCARRSLQYVNSVTLRRIVPGLTVLQAVSSSLAFSLAFSPFATTHIASRNPPGNGGDQGRKLDQGTSTRLFVCFVFVNSLCLFFFVFCFCHFSLSSFYVPFYGLLSFIFLLFLIVTFLLSHFFWSPFVFFVTSLSPFRVFCYFCPFPLILFHVFLFLLLPFVSPFLFCCFSISFFVTSLLISILLLFTTFC